MSEQNKKLTEIRNRLYDHLPTGQINAFDLTILISKHLNDLDEFIDAIPQDSEIYPWTAVSESLPPINEKDRHDMEDRKSIHCICDSQDFEVRGGWYYYNSGHWVLEGVHSGSPIIVNNWMPYPGPRNEKE